MYKLTTGCGRGTNTRGELHALLLLIFFARSSVGMWRFKDYHFD